MGWKRYGKTEFWHGENGNLFDSSLWNPLQNIADAWMIVDRFKHDSDAYIRFTFESHVSPLICAIDSGVICEVAKKTIEAIEARA
ncbi:hypothetical protein [Brevibacillus sp. NPDC003440]